MLYNTYHGLQIVLSINTWVFHRNPDLFGGDCNSFKPDRWLQDDTEKMNPFLIHVSIFQCLLDLQQALTFLYSGEPDTTNAPDETSRNSNSPN